MVWHDALKRTLSHIDIRNESCKLTENTAQGYIKGTPGDIFEVDNVNENLLKVQSNCIRGKPDR